MGGKVQMFFPQEGVVSLSYVWMDRLTARECGWMSVTLYPALRRTPDVQTGKIDRDAGDKEAS